MHFEQIEPELTPMPTVIDHEHEAPHASNLLSVFPGVPRSGRNLPRRPALVVLEKLQNGTHQTASPPWSIDSAEHHPTAKEGSNELR